MRLTCPNCDAQYEVPDRAIPAGGRDVQCSNCGHFWYQMPPGDSDDAEDEVPVGDPGIETADDAIARAMPAAAATASPPELQSAPDTARRKEAEEDALASALADEPDDAFRPTAAVAAAAAVAPAAVARPRSLDESLVALLKEEAEREVQARKSEARRAESPMPETQPDLGLIPPDESADRARRLAALQGSELETAAARPAARRDLLPDVEEINSTLHSSGVEAREAEAELAVLPDLMRPKRGFRSGFSLIMLLLVVGIATYVAAPQLKAQFPAAIATIDAYVATIDGGRLWLDVMMDKASSAILSPSGN